VVCMSDKKVILVIGALAKSLILFRGDLLREFKARGFHVCAMANDKDTDVIAKLLEIDVEFISYSIARNGLNPLKDLNTILDFYKVIKRVKPDMIFAYTIKPIIWAGLVSRFLNQGQFYALVTGLGFAFQGRTLIRRLLTGLVVFLYRLSLTNAVGVIFQNKDSRDYFVDKKMVRLSQATVVAGSGINVERFSLSILPDGDISFLCIARLLGDKGIREYSLAASAVKKSYPNARFLLVGPEDSSPDGISLSEVQKWHDEGIIQFCGSTSDVRPYIAGSHVYVLPSYHEGMPRSTLEAMAMGRPVLTTDALGCRDTVNDGVNGFKVPVRDSACLAEKMLWCIENREKLDVMGKESRKMAEEIFDVRSVNADLLNAMNIS